MTYVPKNLNRKPMQTTSERPTCKGRYQGGEFVAHDPVEMESEGRDGSVRVFRCPVCGQAREY